jgi:hypothetical protein
MRKVVAHLIMTLDGVVRFDVVVDTIMKQRNPEVLADFFAKVTEEDAVLHADLLDELRLEIYPVVAGSVARLF